MLFPMSDAMTSPWKSGVVAAVEGSALVPSLRIAVETRDLAATVDPAGEWWSKSPNSIFRDPAIPDAQKVVLQAIVTLCRSGSTCQDTNGIIGKESGKDEKTVGRLVKRLEDRGLIVREVVGSKRTIRLTFHFRGQLSDPRRSEEVKPVVTPAEVRSDPRASEVVPPFEARRRLRRCADHS